MTVLTRPIQRYPQPNAPLTPVPTTKFLVEELRKIRVALDSLAEAIKTLDDEKQDAP